MATDGVALALIIAPVVRHLAGHTAWLLDNADMLFLPAFFDDLERGGSFGRWHLPASPYFLPDWLIYFAARTITANPFLAAAVYAGIQLALLWFATRAAVSRICPSHGAISALAGWALMVLFVARGYSPIVFAVAPFVHFGTIILTLWAMTITLDLLGERTLRRSSLLLGSLTFVAMLSDRLFLVWFVGPSLVAVIGGLVLGRVSRPAALRWCAATAVATLAALGTHAFLLTNDNPVSYGLTLGGRQRIQAIADEFQIAFAQDWLLSGLLVIVAVAVPLVLAMGRAGARTAGTSNWNAPYVAIVLLATIPSIVAFQMVSTLPPAIRYDMSAFTIPVLLAGVLIPVGKLWINTVALALIMLSIGLQTMPSLNQMETTRYRDDIRCLDDALEATGSRHGVGGYWATKPVTVGSRLELTIATVNNVMLPYPVNGSTSWYEDTYDFILLGDPFAGIEPEYVVGVAGEPLGRVTCGIYTLYDYGPDGLPAVS